MKQPREKVALLKEGKISQELLMNVNSSLKVEVHAFQGKRKSDYKQ